MRRNTGIIGPKTKTTLSDGGGVHDTFDNYNAMKDGTWPVTLGISSISFSFDNTSTISNFLWGDTVSITVNGSGFTNNPLYYTINVTSGGTSFNHWADGSTTGGPLSAASGQQITFSKRLKFQTSAVSAFTFTFEFRLGSTTGPIVETSAPITVAQLIYDVTMPDGTEGNNYYFYPNFSGLTTSTSAYFYSNGSSWISAEWTSTWTRSYYGYQSDGATGQQHGILSRDLTTEGSGVSAGYMRVRFNNNIDQGVNYVTYTKNGSGSASINQDIYVNDTSTTPTITISNITPNEGDTITITVQALTPSGTQFNVTIVDTTTTSDDYGSLSPSGIISMNTSMGGGQHSGQFTHTITRDFVTEGTESFYYQIAAVEDGSPHNSTPVTIQDTTRLSNITVSPTSVNEGSAVTFTVNTIGGVSGQTYTFYYEMISNTGFMGGHDFTDGVTTGSFTISGTSNSGSFTKTLAADGYTEGTEVIKAEVGPTVNGPWTSSPTVSVADTSSGTTEPTGIPYQTSFVECRYGTTMGSGSVVVVNGTTGAEVYTLHSWTGHYGTTNWYNVSTNSYSAAPGHRILFKQLTGNNWYSDWQIDNVVINGTTYNFNVDATGWLSPTNTGTSSSTVAFTAAVQVQNTSSTGYGRWNRYNGNSTPSSGTGSASPYDGYYLYSEGSSYYSQYKWLYSPIIT